MYCKDKILANLFVYTLMYQVERCAKKGLTQARQYTYDVIVRSVRATIAVVGKQ